MFVGGDFAVKKSGWAGVAIRLKQEQDATTFVYAGFMPSAFLRAALLALIGYPVLRPKWQEMEKEVESFI